MAQSQTPTKMKGLALSLPRYYSRPTGSSRDRISTELMLSGAPLLWFYLYEFLLVSVCQDMQIYADAGGVAGAGRWMTDSGVHTSPHSA
jgi:hypothetical protein